MLAPFKEYDMRERPVRDDTTKGFGRFLHYVQDTINLTEGALVGYMDDGATKRELVLLRTTMAGLIDELLETVISTKEKPTVIVYDLQGNRHLRDIMMMKGLALPSSGGEVEATYYQTQLHQIIWGRIAWNGEEVCLRDAIVEIAATGRALISNLDEKIDRIVDYSSEYPRDVWTEKLKEKIRSRDGKCQLCEERQDTADTKLHIHHIDFNKKNCEETNLIALCGRCHNKIPKTKDRFEWIMKCRDILEKRGVIEARV